MGLSFQVAQQASAADSAIAPWMSALALMVIIPLLAYAQNILEKNRPS